MKNMKTDLMQISVVKVYPICLNCIYFPGYAPFQAKIQNTVPGRKCTSYASKVWTAFLIE